MYHVRDTNAGKVFFTCCDCPICIGWQNRIESAREGGYEPQFEYCGCDKMGDWGEFYMTGYCSDAWFVEDIQKKNGSRRTGRAYRRVSGQRMDSRRREESKYAFEMWTNDRNGGNYIGRKHRSNTKVFYKKYSNKKNRRGMCEPTGQKSAHKRTFDLWWVVF